MTALKNLADKINSMKESLSKITVELPNVYDAEVHNIFNKLRNQLGLLETQLMPELLKLDTKKNSKDPVSGAPRYGPKQMEKIELVTKEAISLRIQYEELITIYQSYCTTYLPQKQNLTPKDTLPADLTSVPVFHSQEDKSVITTLSWNSEIHQKAEESRQKRTEEAEVEEARRLQVRC